MSLATATSTETAATTSPMRWVVLAMAAATVFSDYYEADALGPIADLLVRQRHFSQFQIGDLTAVISLPGIPLALLNGLLIDRYGPVRVTFWSAVIGFIGAILTAIGTPFERFFASCLRSPSSSVSISSFWPPVSL